MYSLGKPTLPHQGVCTLWMAPMGFYLAWSAFHSHGWVTNAKKCSSLKKVRLCWVACTLHKSVKKSMAEDGLGRKSNWKVPTSICQSTCIFSTHLISPNLSHIHWMMKNNKNASWFPYLLPKISNIIRRFRVSAMKLAVQFFHCTRDWWNSGAKQYFSQFHAAKILALCWHQPYFPNFSCLMVGKSLIHVDKIFV